jgi:hypothetical protein
MKDCKSALTPFLSGVKIEDGDDTPLVDNTLYKNLLGSFLYLTHSRPDLFCAVSTISRFMQEPHDLYWKDAKCILRYVHGTITFGIHYATYSTLDLIGFTNSDWDGYSIDHNSKSGYSLSHGFGPICWSIKKQVAISLSSGEEEYKGVVNITI